MSTTDVSQDMRVAPDSVRVWRGFRLPSLGLDQFLGKLGTVFVPATVKMQIDAGLRAYAPTVPAGLPGKPATVPDETAILFWASPETYWNGFTRLAVRTYTLTHGGVYLTQDNQSRADFPVRFDGALGVDQPVYLYDAPADWMHGAIRHLVAARPPAVDPHRFARTSPRRSAIFSGACRLPAHSRARATTMSSTGSSAPSRRAPRRRRAACRACRPR